MGAHGPLLVRYAHKVTTGPGSTQQHKPGIAILGEVRVRCRLIDIPFDQPGSTRQAAALMTNGRQSKPEAEGDVPDEFVLSAFDHMNTVG